jgi:hypothetical protein
MFKRERACCLGLQAFDFDRVFGPEVQQAGVFQDVSQLVTSALDGYNVCIFAYGQTGEAHLACHFPHSTVASNSALCL